MHLMVRPKHTQPTDDDRHTNCNAHAVPALSGFGVAGRSCLAFRPREADQRPRNINPIQMRKHIRYTLESLFEKPSFS